MRSYSEHTINKINKKLRFVAYFKINMETESENLSEGGNKGPETGAEIEDIKKSVKSFPRKLSRRSSAIKVVGSTPKHREKVSRWYGWGYKDTGFEMTDGIARLTGDKYLICDQELPYLCDYIKEKFDVLLDGNMAGKSPKLPEDSDYPTTRFCQEDLEAIESLDIEVSTEGVLRLTRSQGQAMDDVWRLRSKQMIRIPDAVCWPTCHEEVVELVKLADERNFVIIPFGGGTSVAGAVECPHLENRPILSVDTTAMNEILWVDHESLIVCVESGIVGQDLERELRKLGYTTGHEPDSIEFSTLGGWVSTRASGMKKNRYGNIEDILVHVRMVTPRGTLEKGTKVPRLSAGPDFDHLIMGSEGSWGLITEVTLKIRPFPECQHYGSLVFPDFETGIKYMREVAKRRWQPASIRLMDQEQFQIGLSLRTKASFLAAFLDGLKFTYLQKIKGFNLKKMCLTTIVYEGDKPEVLEHEKRLNKLALGMQGLPSGGTNGQRGYMMTFVVAYIRDIALEFNVVSDSVETSMPWQNVAAASRRVRSTIAEECVRIGSIRSLCMMRVAQTYDAGCCLYIYFAFRVHMGCDVIRMADHVHNALREDILSFGGSISHHHGVGKHKRKFYEAAVSPVGVDLFRATKAQLDPNNVFGAGNFLDDEVEQLCTPKSKL